MSLITHDDQTFTNISYAEKRVEREEFQSCIFKQCDFSNSRFSGDKFLDCTFINCNLSLMKLPDTTLSNAIFKDCKIMGVIFSECRDFLFSVQFESCQLDYASLMNRKMPKTKFIKCSMKDANFSQANLSGSLFDECDLSGTIFNKTDLSFTNFTTAYNYSIEPELNNLKKAIFSIHGLGGLLDKYGIKIV